MRDTSGQVSNRWHTIKLQKVADNIQNRQQL